MLKPHQKARIVGLIQQIRGDTSADQDINMQAVTAQRLVGAGESHGAGDVKSRSLIHFSKLPERHNDMIFAVIVNRFGFWGGIGLFGLYLLWIVGAFLTAASIREPFSRLVIVGFATFMAAQVFINVGMNIGLVPIIGITLPFVSYGGSSMVTAWIMTGTIMGIAARRGAMPTRRSFEYSDQEQ
jgi:rod shape determining protein RodA